MGGVPIGVPIGVPMGLPLLTEGVEVVAYADAFVGMAVSVGKTVSRLMSREVTENFGLFLDVRMIFSSSSRVVLRSFDLVQCLLIMVAPSLGTFQTW